MAIPDDHAGDEIITTQPIREKSRNMNEMKGDLFSAMRRQREQRIQMLLSLWEAQLMRIEHRAVTYFYEANTPKIADLFPAKRKAEQRIQGLSLFLQKMDESK